MLAEGRAALVLVPLDLDGHLVSGKLESAKARQLRNRVAADFVGWESDPAKMTASLDRVLAALRGPDAPPPG